MIRRVKYLIDGCGEECWFFTPVCDGWGECYHPASTIRGECFHSSFADWVFAKRCPLVAVRGMKNKTFLPNLTPISISEILRNNSVFNIQEED